MKLKPTIDSLHGRPERGADSGLPEEQEGQNLSQPCRGEETPQQVWWKGEELTLCESEAAADMRQHIYTQWIQI